MTSERGAVRLASSKDTIANLNEETLTARRDKHPTPHPNSTIPSAPAVGGLTSIWMSTEEVGSIRSFPSTSAAGPDGLRLQLLLPSLLHPLWVG